MLTACYIVLLLCVLCSAFLVIEGDEKPVVVAIARIFITLYATSLH